MKKLVAFLLVLGIIAVIVHADIPPEPQQTGAQTFLRLSRSVNADSLRCYIEGTAACTTRAFDGMFDYTSLNLVATGDSVDLSIIIDACNILNLWVPQDTVTVTGSGNKLEWISKKLSRYTRLRIIGGSYNGTITPTQVDSLVLARKRPVIR